MNLQELCEEAVASCMNMEYANPKPRLIRALRRLMKSERWSATTQHRHIHLRRDGSDHIYTPCTAIHWCVTGEDLHRGSFTQTEISERFALPWYEVAAIVRAETACDCGGRYDREFRNEMLAVLNLPLENTSR